MDVADPVQMRMLDLTDGVLHDRIVLRELQREGGRCAGAQIEFAEHNHYDEDYEPSLKRLTSIGGDAD